MRIRSKFALRGTAAVAVAAALTLSSGILPTHRAEAATSTIYFTSLGDTNLEDLYRNTVIPDFQKAYPQYTVHASPISCTGLTPRKPGNRQPGRGAKSRQEQRELRHFRRSTALPINTRPARTYKDYFLPLSTANIPNATKVPPGGRGAKAWGTRYLTALLP